MALASILNVVLTWVVILKIHVRSTSSSSTLYEHMHELEPMRQFILLTSENPSCRQKEAPPISRNREVNPSGANRTDEAFSLIKLEGGGPRLVVSNAAFHARVRDSFSGLGGLKETKMFLPHPLVKISIVESLRNREVACSASDQQGWNF